MVEPAKFLRNAERLIADARHLQSIGSIRSATTLAVVAIEQFGEFIEALTKEQFPNSSQYIGLFGKKPNAHARRQDVIAGHVLNFVMSNLINSFLIETFISRTGCMDSDKYIQWMLQCAPIEFTDEQKRRLREDQDMRTANLLLTLARTNQLKQLREHGLYEDGDTIISAELVDQLLRLAESVREILRRSHTQVNPFPMGLAGVNMSSDPL